MNSTTERVSICTPDGRDAALVPADDAGKFRVEVIARDPWTVLLNARLISDQEHAAAEAHSATWVAARWVEAGRSGYEPATSGVFTEPADRLGEEAMDAWRRFRSAQAAIPVFTRGVVYNCVAYYERPTDVRAFRVGLRWLARFYGV